MRRDAPLCEGAAEVCGTPLWDGRQVGESK